jgi:hypothetical protein
MTIAMYKVQTSTSYALTDVRFKLAHVAAATCACFLVSPPPLLTKILWSWRVGIWGGMVYHVYIYD